MCRFFNFTSDDFYYYEEDSTKIEFINDNKWYEFIEYAIMYISYLNSSTLLKNNAIKNLSNNYKYICGILWFVKVRNFLCTIYSLIYL